MSREPVVRGEVEAVLHDPKTSELEAIAELLGAVAMEIAALTDHLADAGSRDGVVEL